MNNNNKLTGFIIENLITFFVILSLSCIFVEDFMKFAGGIVILKYVQLFCLMFDLIFAIEFIVHFLYSFIKMETKAYFFYGKGWVDLLSSFPVLVLISMPVFLDNFFGVTFWASGLPNSILLLRLLRILKLVKVLKYKKSVLFQKQISSISTIITLAVITFLFSINVLQENRFLFNTNSSPGEYAFVNLVYFSMILFIIICLSFFYGRQFKIYIFHPITEIIRGFEEIYYTKDVKIPKINSKDEISLLAESFNKRWLPAKKRKLMEIKSKGITVFNSSKKGNADEY